MLLALSLLAATEESPSFFAMCQASSLAKETEVANAATNPSDRDVKIIISAQTPYCSGWTVVTIFSSFSSEGRWILRKSAKKLDESEPTITWATSRTCPQIFDALESLERLPMRFALDRAVRPPPNPSADIPLLPKIVLHGVSYTVETAFAGQPSGYGASIKLSSNAGEVATWAGTTLDSMTNCWTKVEPVGQRR